MVTRKEYGRAGRGATKKRTASTKKASKPRIYASRAKTPAGKKRALIRAKTREARERFRLEKLGKARRAEIQEAKARGERAPSRRKSVVAQALALTRRAVRWVGEQVKTITQAVLGDPRQEFYNFAHGPIARDHLRRLHEKPEKLNTYTGERVAGRIGEYLTYETLPWILSVIDVGAERLRGHDRWNITVFLFSDGKDQVGSPKPVENVGKYQASFEGGGWGDTYAEAREKLRRELLGFIEHAVGDLFVLYYVLFTRNRGDNE